MFVVVVRVCVYEVRIFEFLGDVNLVPFSLIRLDVSHIINPTFCALIPQISEIHDEKRFLK